MKLKNLNEFSILESTNVVDDINNGVVINKLFHDFVKIKNFKDFEKWETTIKSTKFGTYSDKDVLDVIDNFNPIYDTNDKKEFLKAIQNILKNNKYTTQYYV